MEDAVESLLRHTDTLTFSSGASWGPWLTTHMKDVDRFVIYMPTVPGIPYFETKLFIPHLRRLKVDVTLGFGWGRDEAASKNKDGRLTGVGIGLKTDKRYSKQIWRMDIHGDHGVRGTGDYAYFTDPPYHYHVLRPGK